MRTIGKFKKVVRWTKRSHQSQHFIWKVFRDFFFRRRIKNLNPMHFVETGFVIKRRFWSTRTITLVWNESVCVRVRVCVFECVWCKKVCVSVFSSVCLRERKRVSLRIKEKGREKGQKAVLYVFVCVVWVCGCVCRKCVGHCEWEVNSNIAVTKCERKSENVLACKRNDIVQTKWFGLKKKWESEKEARERV